MKKTMIVSAMMMAMSGTAMAVDTCPADGYKCVKQYSPETIKAWQDWDAEHKAGTQGPIVIKQYPNPKVITKTVVETETVTEVVEVPVEVKPSVRVSPFAGVCYGHTNVRNKITSKGINTHGVDTIRNQTVTRDMDDSEFCLDAGIEVSKGGFGAYADINTMEYASAGLLLRTENTTWTAGLAYHLDDIAQHEDIQGWLNGALSSDTHRVQEAMNNGSFAHSCSSSDSLPLKFGFHTNGRIQLNANVLLRDDTMDCATSGRSGTNWSQSLRAVNKESIMNIGVRYAF